MLRSSHCRSCWNQARAEARAADDPDRRATASRFLDRVGGFHQLFFAGMLNQRGAATTPERKHDRRGAPRKPPPPAARRPAADWIQPGLFDTARDFTRFNDSTDADPGNPWLVWAIYRAYLRSEARGWRPHTLYLVRRGLTIVLSSHRPGDVVRHSELFSAMRAQQISGERVAEVLDEMGVLVDDRRPSFEGWLERKLHGLAEGISDEAEAWARTLHDGGPRTKARDPGTVWHHMNNACPRCWPGPGATTICVRSPVTTSWPSWKISPAPAAPAP